MDEKNSPPPTGSYRSIDQIREGRDLSIQASEKIARGIGLPKNITGSVLLGAMNEIVSFIERGNTTGSNESMSKQISAENQKILQERAKNAQLWYYLRADISRPGFDFQEYEKQAKIKNPQFVSIKKVILDMIWSGVQIEAALQKIDKLEGSYHLAKNHALMAMIASEVTQEYAEEFFEEGRWDIVKKTFALPEKGLDIAKTKAGQLVEKAKPSLRKYLSTMTPEKQDKLFGRMVKFLSEDDIGKRLVAMSEAMPGAAVTKGLTGSLKSTVSGVKEGIFSPLCACMMAMMLDGAEDKEKTMIQYVTFLVAGQIIQEGGKVPMKMIDHFAKLAPKNANVRNIKAKLLRLERAGGAGSKLAILTLSVGLVVAAFQIPMVTDFVANIANSIDENWDHGTGREVIIGGVSAASYLMQFSSKRFVPVAVALEAGQIALDGANPFKDQDEFLFKFITGDADNLIQTGEQLVGRNPIAAWNSRVDSAKKGENTTQKSIIDQSKLQDGNDWALRTIVPFRQELNEFENHETQLKLLLSQLKVSPISSTPLSVSVDAQNLRYRDYALAGDDVWHTRDGLGTESLQGSFWEPQKRGFMQVPWTGGFDPRNIADSVSAVSRGMGWGNLSGRNDKALAWLDDVAGSPENRLDEFFEHECDALIAAEKAKCQRLKYSSPSIGNSYPGYTPPQYEFDTEAYKKIEPWVKQLEAARNEWKAMRATADELAKKVVTARGLGVYDSARWTAPGSEGNPLIEPGENESPTMAFQGMMNEIARRFEIIDLTTPTDASKASAILDAAGSGLRMYGDDIIDGEWRERNEDEYTKWVEKNGFGIDDRHIHTDRLKQLIREVFKAGIPVEYIEMSLKSVSSVARNQSEGKYVTPDMVREIEGKLGNYLLDKAFRDTIRSGANIDTLDRVEYNCPGYSFIRTYTPEKNDTGIVFRVEDKIKTTSYRAVPGGGASQVMTSERTIGSKSIPKESLLRNIQLTQVQIVREEKVQAEKDQIAQAQIREKALFRQQKDIHKGDNEANFREYYSSSELSQKNWTEVSEKGIPVVFAHLRGGSSMSAIPESGWGWKQPDFHNAIVISAYFGPGDIREVTLGRLDALKSLDNNLQKACKIALSSGKLTDPLRSIINMCDGSILYGSSGRVKQNYVSDLYQEIIPDFEKASDKKAFLTKTLDELLKYNGISGENFDTIVSNITGK